jgi:putative transposase
MSDLGVTATVYFFPNFGNACLMARIARLVVPAIPHHVTRRGNLREKTFFGDSGYRLYREWLGIAAAKAGVEIWAYCLMLDRVHAVVTPKDEDGAMAHLRRFASVLH